jgi:hypothetical protein
MPRAAGFKFTDEQRHLLRLDLERKLRRSRASVAPLIDTLQAAIGASRWLLEKDSRAGRRAGHDALARLDEQLTALICCLDVFPHEEGEEIDHGWEWAWAVGSAPPFDKF